jgi:2-C-methyl-D-erythritol 2,4-cyclodiphosphate synthase
MRVGQGYDVHRFKEGDHVMLGGIRIPHTRGIEAHSDGDVILHALCDALLGAAGLGDIGMFYPPSDPQYAGKASRFFLVDVNDKLKSLHYGISNVDITLIAEAPKLGPYRQQIRESIARILEINESNVNIKATTTEKLGFCGREEGIAALAIAVIARVLP